MRTTAYCLLLAVFASVLMFWELGEDALFSDEAQYALVVHHMKKPGGSWLYASPYPPTPYHQKPPLYFWLTSATYDLLGREEFAFRAWSAAAGVGAVVLTCILGAMLFTPEIGAFAALLLMTNRAFVLIHGARSGTLDALLTFLILAGAVAYWLGARRGLGWKTWVVVGVFAGLASLTKPLAGVPLVALLALHALLVQRNASLRVRLLGPAITLFVLAAVAGPWYVAQWKKYDSFLGEMFGHNLAQRIAYGLDERQIRDWKFYVEQVTKSSVPFWLSGTAVVYGIIAWAARFKTRQHSLLVLLGTGWILLFSISASKAVHYVYPAFPFVALMIAGALAMLGRAAMCRYSVRPAAVGAFVAILVAAFAFHYARLTYYVIPADRSPHVPWEMYKTLASATKSGEARVVFCGFPEKQTDWRRRMSLRARDCFYLERIRADKGAAWISGSGELASLLIEHKPSLLVVSRLSDVPDLLSDPTLRHRTDQRFVYAHQAYTVLGVDLNPLLDVVATPGQSNRYVQILEQTLPDAYRFRISAPVVGGARIGVTLRLTEPEKMDAVRCVLTLETNANGGSKTLEDQVAPSTNGLIKAAGVIDQDSWSRAATHDVTLTLQPSIRLERGPVRTTLEDIRVTTLPHIPPESHLRR